MSRISWATLALPVLLITASSGLAQQKIRSQSDGISVAEFRNLANSLPPLPGTIEAIRFFYEPKNSGKPSVAFATYKRQNGWQISIFHATGNANFQLEWQSDKLEDSFKISYPGALHVFGLGFGQTIYFQGCASHACPEVFSILLYNPQERASFTANYILGKITYSPNLKLPQDRYYKSILDELIKQNRQN